MEEEQQQQQQATSPGSTPSPHPPMKTRSPDHHHHHNMHNQRSPMRMRMQLRGQGLQAAETSAGTSPAALAQHALQLWRPSANLSIDTVNRLPHKVKRYYQDILGWGEALPGYASAALQMGGGEYLRLLQEYREGQSQSKLWQAAYVKAFCNNLRTFLRDYNRWMLQHWPAAIEEIFLYPASDVTFQHLTQTLRYMNDFSVPIREALYIFKKIQHAW
ncbi:hypothetical protein GOP47_0006781 [Adiantum capillus-veneris]|uniref:Uncharacterized protein n=1 Tax=Adiantum capillus-veneris TaxID=13818 RepID=A0A9D4V3J1_ADICA|nr:hypothetical protein GOP47_0006781 [Adiantum capillus-veneris]